MPIDFTQQLTSIDGEPLTEVILKDKVPTDVPCTLGRIACSALLGNVPNEANADAEEHLRRFILAQTIHDNHDATLSSEQVSLLKERIAKGYNSALIVGQAIAMLDPGAAGKRAA